MINPITDDHFYPESWYPSNTPLNLEKWTVPACQACNRKKAKLDDYAFMILVPGLQTSSEAYEDIRARHRRAIDVNSATNLKDAVKRRQRGFALLSTFKQHLWADPRRIVPTHVQPPLNKGEPFNVVQFDGARVREQFLYMLKGLAHVLHGGLLVDGAMIARVDFFDKAVVIDQAKPYLQNVRVENFDRGPGFQGQYVCSTWEEKPVFFCGVTIWEYFYFYGLLGQGVPHLVDVQWTQR